MCMVLVGAKPGMPCSGNNASVHFNTMLKTLHALVVAVVAVVGNEEEMGDGGESSSAREKRGDGFSPLTIWVLKLVLRNRRRHHPRHARHVRQV